MLEETLLRSRPADHLTPDLYSDTSQADSPARSPDADEGREQTDLAGAVHVPPTGPKKWYPSRPKPTILTVTSRYGPDKSRRMLRCRTCKDRFSERKGTPLFGARLDPGTVESVLEHIAEGCGV